MYKNGKFGRDLWLDPKQGKDLCRFVNRKQRFAVLALRRSGHHAVIHWICRQHDHRVVFHNLCGIKNKKGSEIHIYGHGSSPVRHIHNFENFNFNKIMQLHVIMPLAHFILVVREARNWIASCLKRRETARYEYEKDVFKELPQRIELWKQHAKIALDAPSWLKVILFDRWVSDAEYRLSICKRLDIPFTDAGLNDVVRFGSGSSFDARRYHGRAQEMDVLNRWKEFEGDPLMNRMMTDELIGLNQRLFPGVMSNGTLHKRTTNLIQHEG